jgi:hypothetical protein
MVKPELGNPVTLRQHQVLFASLLALLILHADDTGHDVAIGEVWRSPEEAKRLAGTGAGLATSLHCDRLAADLILFADTDGDGQVDDYLTRSEDYAELGVYWKSLHPLCRWGGDFHGRPDGNHFSLAYHGRA